MSRFFFQDCTLDAISQWSIGVKLSTVFLSILLVISLGCKIFLASHWENYQNLLQEEKILKTTFEFQQSSNQNIQDYQKQLQILTEKQKRTLKILANKSQISKVLEEISKNGVALGLKFELFAPQKEVVKRFYIEMPIRITASGDYHHLALFFSSIAQMNFLITTEDFVIERMALEEQLSMKLTLKIYQGKKRKANETLG